jgi:hypothetical protein
MAAGPSRTKVSTGNIAPSRFVKLSTTLDGKCTQAGAGEKIFGISQQGTRNTPYGSLDDGYAAIAGENLQIYGPGDDGAVLELGGTVAAGDRLKSDANGKGVTTVTNLDEVGAVAMVAGTSGQLVPVQPIYPAQISS